MPDVPKKRDSGKIDILQALKSLWRKKLTILLSKPFVSQTAVWCIQCA